MFGDTIFYNAQRPEISELETAIRPKYKHDILCQFCLPTIFKKICIKMAEKTWGNYILNIQGQLTPLSVVGSDRNTNLSELLCMSMIPTRMIKSKMKVLEWQYFSLMVIPDAQRQLTPGPQSQVRAGCNCN